MQFDRGHLHSRGLASELHKPTTIFSGAINFPYLDSDFSYQEMAMHSLVYSWRKKTSKALKLKVLPWSRHWRTGPSLLPEICQGAVFNSNYTQSSGSLSPLSIRQSICSQPKIPLHPFRGQHIRMMLSSAVWSQHESRLLALPSPAIPLLLRIDTEKLLKTWSLQGIQNSQPHNQTEDVCSFLIPKSN